MSFFARLRTPTYKNTGSTARDHLASERTFLAWIRSGLGFIALGIAVERFSQLEITELLKCSAQASTSTRPQKIRSRFPSTDYDSDKEHLLVGALLGTGMGSIVYGTVRYFSNLRLLERELFRPAYFGAAGLSTGVAGLSAAVYLSALQTRRRKEEAA